MIAVPALRRAMQHVGGIHLSQPSQFCTFCVRRVDAFRRLAPEAAAAAVRHGFDAAVAQEIADGPAGESTAADTREDEIGGRAGNWETCTSSARPSTYPGSRMRNASMAPPRILGRHGRSAARSLGSRARRLTNCGKRQRSLSPNWSGQFSQNSGCAVVPSSPIMRYDQLPFIGGGGNASLRTRPIAP